MGGCSSNGDGCNRNAYTQLVHREVNRSVTPEHGDTRTYLELRKAARALGATDTDLEKTLKAGASVRSLVDDLAVKLKSLQTLPKLLAAAQQLGVTEKEIIDGKLDDKKLNIDTDVADVMNYILVKLRNQLQLGSPAPDPKNNQAGGMKDMDISELSECARILKVSHDKLDNCWSSRATDDGRYQEPSIEDIKHALCQLITGALCQLKDPHEGQTHRIQDLDANTYDAAMLTLCFLADGSMEHDWFMWFQVVFAWGLHVAVVTLQFMLVLLMYATVVEQGENAYMHGLENKTTAVTNAVVTNTPLDKQSEVMELCRQDHTLGSVHTMVLLLWFSKMLAELVSVGQRIKILWVMETPPKAGEIIDDVIIIDDSGEIVQEKYPIIYLDLRHKLLLICFIEGPHLLVSLFLTFMSAKYLTLEGDMSRLVLKAVSMQFIATIDELIYAAFVPVSFKMKVKVASLKYPGVRPKVAEQWAMSGVYLFATILFMLVMTHWVLGDLTNFRYACRDYYSSFPHERIESMVLVTAVKDAIGWG